MNATLEAHQQINQSSGGFEYYTPEFIIKAARGTLGIIDLDPASSEQANRMVQADKIFTIADDGLSQRWSGRVWMNHPFARRENHKWIDKIVRSYRDGGVSAACCITYACTSEAWFQPLLYYPQCYLCPRTNYHLPDGSLKVGVTKGSVVTYLGPAVKLFAAHFGNLGTIKVDYHNHD